MFVFDIPSEWKHFAASMEIQEANTRPGKHTESYGKIHHFQWENPL